MNFQTKKRFGELLVEEERIKEQDLERALSEQQKYGLKLGQVLFKMGLLSEEAVAEVLSRQLAIPVVKLDDSDLPDDLIGLIPKNIARNCNVIPIERHYNWIRVAMTDPLDIAAMDEVAHFLRLEVLPSLATESEINRALERYYGMRPAENREADFSIWQKPEPLTEHQVQKPETEHQKQGPVEVATEETPRIRLAKDGQPLSLQQQPENAYSDFAVSPDDATKASVTALISLALSMEATDIHIEADWGAGYIRMRVDGKLKMTKAFREQTIPELVVAIKERAGLDQTALVAGDGRFDFSPDVSVRVSSCPTVRGKRIVLRPVDKRLSSYGLDALGMAPEVEETLRRALRQPGGLAFCTGPIGSGKTTTLYAIVNHLNAMDKAIVTIEDPIEYSIDHVAQTQVDPKAGFDLNEGVQSVLRQDPDICVVGEIKELETANLAAQAALAGITVLSTFSWNDAIGTLVRLADMGLEASLLSSSVVCCIGQRLIRKICEGCKDVYTPPQPVLDSLKISETVPLYRGKGCPTCHNTGYRGRTAVFEVLFMNTELRNLVASKASRAGIEKAAAANNMRTMREEAIKKALLGVTTLEEALNRTKNV